MLHLSKCNQMEGFEKPVEDGKMIKRRWIKMMETERCRIVIVDIVYLRNFLFLLLNCICE